jgi:hypothetical protein
MNIKNGISIVRWWRNNDKSLTRRHDYEKELQKFAKDEDC